MATAKPRSRKSRTVSKYFSICSLRPVKTQTVPLRPAGGAQRANRNSAPSGVLMVPETTSSGTGLAGIETSVMRRNRLGEKGWKSRQERKKEACFASLERRFTPPISFLCRPLPVFRNRNKRLHRTTARPDGGRVIETVAQWRTTHAYLRSHPVLSFHRRLRPLLQPARSGDRRRQPRLSALQHRAHRRERLSHQRGGVRLLAGRTLDRRQGKHVDDQGRENRQ